MEQINCRLFVKQNLYSVEKGWIIVIYDIMGEFFRYNIEGRKLDI